MKKIVILLFVVFSILTNAQTAEQILIKVQQNDSLANYKVDLKYQLYKGLNGDKLLEEKNGIYVKYNNNIYNKTHNTESIITPKFYVKVNHDEKALVFLKNKSIKPNTKSMFIGVSNLLKQFENPKIIKNDNFWVIRLITKEYSQLSISMITLTINKTDYKVKKQVLILSNLTNFAKNNDKNDYNLPRLEISFSNYKQVTKDDEDLFNMSKYITENNNKITVSNYLKNYEIIN